ncbi:galactosyl transferase GMA12 MNN10 family [Pyrenophora seminiperda CCB06]|uniref:Galactosyl transferase GMA12 MNN10 family n=1 Tax=Pyrenophora seminiperda CCB06 TaxID=1302712 RepID=A0A3M7M5T1_9PLEO|nr:galactosyl transferase GMA12 MNN10 family [Pyrenophora seminiperda CCB06]
MTKLNCYPPSGLPLNHGPQVYPHRLSKAAYRTLKYLSLILIFLLTLYTLSAAPSLSKYVSLPSNTLANTTFSPNSTSAAKIAKVTASFGLSDPIYETAISSHSLHNALHNYTSFILRERMLPGLWSKHAFLLTILGSQLALPPSSRLDWLFWHDRDTILTNPNVPLDIFLPPPNSKFSHVNLVVTKDRNGLNNGVFFIRVNEWSVRFFAACLSLREWEKGVVLKYSEQSAMEIVIERDSFRPSTIFVPQYWFNAFPPPISPPTLASSSSSSQARTGALLMHFASNRDGKRPQRMAHWAEVARNESSGWNIALNETGLVEEVAGFWGV